MRVELAVESLPVKARRIRADLGSHLPEGNAEVDGSQLRDGWREHRERGRPTRSANVHHRPRGHAIEKIHDVYVARPDATMRGRLTDQVIVGRSMGIDEAT